SLAHAHSRPRCLQSPTSHSHFSIAAALRSPSSTPSLETDRINQETETQKYHRKNAIPRSRCMAPPPPL
ncbi:hypothetical protein ACHAXN_000662, partial [Cyclotella atomus]